MLEAKGLGELLVFMRHKLGNVVSKTASRDAVAYEMGFSKIDDGGW